MKYGHRDLLTLLISLFILSGCENPTGVGLEVAPEDQINALFTDTISLEAYTVKDDSSQSAAFNHFLFGNFDDPIFGTTSSALAFEFGRSAGFKPIRPDASIDSVVLVLPYGGSYYGDTLASTFSLRVRPLDEAFTFNTFTTKTWDVNEQVLGSVSLSRYRVSDSISVIPLNDPDTLYRVRPQLRMRLDTAYFKSLLSNSVDSAVFASDTRFRNHIKGLYLDVNVGSSTGMGGLVTFMALNGVSGVELHYRQPNGKTGDDAAIDTIRTLLPIYPFSTNSGAAASLASSIKNEYSAEVLDQLVDPTEQKESIYLHAPTGLRGRLLLPYIDELKGKGLLINKAELVLYVDEDRMESPFTRPAPRITLYREDIAGRRQNIPDGATTSATGMPADPRSLNYFGFGGWYQQTTKRYIFHLTSYIQDVLLGKINGNELFIAPVSIYDQYVPVQPAANAGGRVIIGGPGNPNYRMKLNLYYTETNRPQAGQ